MIWQKFYEIVYKEDAMIYISSSCLSSSKISNVVEQLATTGFKNIELSGGTDYYSEIFGDLIYLKKQYGLIYSCHSYFPPPKNDFVINLASCNDVIYECSISHYENCIQQLPQIDCRDLSIHAGFMMELSTKDLGNEIETEYLYDYNDSIERFCSAYKKLHKLAKQNNITVYLENNVLSKENFQKYGRDCLMMIDSIAILELRKRLEFNLLLDLAHLYVTCNSLGNSFENEVRALTSFAKWIHISSNDSLFDQHKPLTPECPITNVCSKFIKPEIKLTLETKGSLDEIIGSYNILSTKMTRPITNNVMKKRECFG